MWQIRYGYVLALSLLVAMPAVARDVPVMRPIAAALDTPDAHRELRRPVRFYFGAPPAMSVAQKFGQVEVHRRTIVNSNDIASCDRVFVAVLSDMQKRATAAGANAVINIISDYDHHAVSSQTEYECHRGSAVTGVTLRGDLVRLAQ